ncbi:hypothetical protein BDQ17DRAFT_1435173 [Cyathus striatus]|nr:hypothetical protein BDQ17DRAFT_1435173 [Cyathus striatus]
MVQTSSYTPLLSNEDLPLQTLDKKTFTIKSPDARLAPPQNWTFLTRWLAFVTCEAGFLFLGAYCLSNPLLVRLPQFLEDQAKGIFTVLMIGWQTLCVLSIGPIVTNIFSSEWHFQLRRTGAVIPRQTDRVSILTSDLIDQIRHCFSSSSSRTFRIALSLSLALLALKGTAPAAIGVSTVPLQFEIDIPIADLSVGSGVVEENDYFEFSRPLVIRRAAITTHIEQLENTPYKYKSPPNIIVPVPLKTEDNLNAGNLSGGPVTYRSDFGKFNFTCEWAAPVGADNLVDFVGKEWELYPINSIVTENFTTGEIMPPSLYLCDGSGQFAGIFPLFPITRDGNQTDFQSTIETTISIYMFAGRNSTVGPDNIYEGFNLDNIPTSQTDQIFNLTDLLFTAAPLISLLVCDPHFELSTGDVTLHPDGSLEVSNTTGVPLGNMQQNVTNFMFSTGMIDVVTYSELNEAIQSSTLSWFMNDIAATIFTSNPSFDPNKPPYITTLPLDQIEKNINAYFVSASKAFTDGYRFHSSVDGESIVPIAYYNNMTVKGTIELPSTAVVTSRLVYYLTIFEVGLVTILTLFLYRGWKRGKAYPFSFDSLLSAKMLKDL